MIKVTKALKEKGLKAEQCPQAIVERIQALKELTDRYNEACDEYDEQPDRDEETERRLDGMENTIASQDTELAEEIVNISFEQPKGYEKLAEPAQPAEKPKEEKKSSTGFWVLAGTLVAGIIGINFMKNR